MEIKLKTLAIFVSILNLSFIHAQDTKNLIRFNKDEYPLYPQTIDSLSGFPSPFTSDEGKEIVIAFLKNKKYTLVPVTIENKTPCLQCGSEMIGKGNQLAVNGDDFPALKKTGLHSEKELLKTKAITGKPISEITETGRPQRFSWTGFMCNDEDIISILRCDNRIVQKLNLTHPQLAKPLFHIWNLILKEYDQGNIGRHWDNIEYILYNDYKVKFGNTHPTRGFQESIFNDEIRGTWDITIKRDLKQSEIEYINKKYSHLEKESLDDFVSKLSIIRVGEMQPYYIMRYGFYEGHTMWRADPVSISFIFGLKNLEEIDKNFEGNLYKVLMDHFTHQTIDNYKVKFE